MLYLIVLRFITFDYTRFYHGMFLFLDGLILHEIILYHVFIFVSYHILSYHIMSFCIMEDPTGRIVRFCSHHCADVFLLTLSFSSSCIVTSDSVTHYIFTHSHSIVRHNFVTYNFSYARNIDTWNIVT